MQVELPWPPATLSPNARGSWRTKETDRKQYKFLCGYLAKQAKGTIPAAEQIPLNIIFYPPTKRRRDLDNMLASIKYGLDGIADAWGINDANFRPITIDAAEPVKGGKVVVSW